MDETVPMIGAQQN